MNRRHLWVAAQAAVTVVLLTLLFRRLDRDAFAVLFARLPISFYLLSLGVVLTGQVLYAWRWRLVLVALGVRAPFPLVLRQYFIGVFFNNFLPSTIGGDLGRVYLLGREYGYRGVTASVIVDRLLGLGVLAVFCALMLWSVELPAQSLLVARVAVTVIAMGSLALFVLLMAGTGGLPERVAPLGRRAVDIARHLQRLRVDIAAAVASPLLIAKAAAVVIGYFLAIGGLYVMFITQQAGTSPGFVTTTGVVMATSVLSHVPVSLNGVGLREQLHVTLLAPLAVRPEIAIGISLLLYVHLLLGSVIGFVCWYHTRTVAVAVAPVDR